MVYVFDSGVLVGVLLLQLIEAGHLLIELAEKCKKLAGSTFSLIPPKPLITLFEGYKLHIFKEGGIDRETVNCIKDIVSHHALSVNVEEEGFLIYRKRR